MAAQQQLQKLKADVQKKLHEQNAFTNVLAKIEAKTNIDRFYLVSGRPSLFHFSPVLRCLYRSLFVEVREKSWHDGQSFLVTYCSIVVYLKCELHKSR